MSSIAAAEQTNRFHQNGSPPQRLSRQRKEFTRLRDELSRKRRELHGKGRREYTFEGRTANNLADLFAGRSQLVVYHFMFGPGGAKAAKLLVSRRPF